MFYPGVENMIYALSKSLPLAIVTAGHKDQLEQTVPEKFLKLFSVVVCGDMTSENKPSPVPYQTACRLLQIEPENSVVVENAPLGVQSALSAGCYCIAVTSTCSAADLSQSHETVEKVTDIFQTNILKNFETN